jgi:hypothetical protein
MRLDFSGESLQRLIAGDVTPETMVWRGRTIGIGVGAPHFFSASEHVHRSAPTQMVSDPEWSNGAGYRGGDWDSEGLNTGGTYHCKAW